MSWPNFHITISGSVVAAYAAVLSTITGAALELVYVPRVLNWQWFIGREGRERP
jgi:hypothetical protein